MNNAEPDVLDDAFADPRFLDELEQLCHSDMRSVIAVRGSLIDHTAAPNPPCIANLTWFIHRSTPILPCA